MNNKIAVIFTLITVLSVLVVFETIFNNIQSANGLKAQGNITLVSQKYKSGDFSEEMIGKVKNKGNATTKFVKITANFYDTAGDIIDTNYVYADPYDLSAGQKAPFKLNVDKQTANDMNSYEISLSWKNADMSETYKENVSVQKQSSGNEESKIAESEIEENGDEESSEDEE